MKPKKYTESELRDILRRTLIDVTKHQQALSMVSFALAMKDIGLKSEAILDVLVKTNEYKFEALCFEELRNKLMEETGLDLDLIDETV